MTARVLVVDDILPNVKLLEAKLSAEYFEVITAMNGIDALAIAEKELPDIILLDVMMPGMDGFEVCKHIKSNPKLVHIPVVMVTALDQPSDRVKGLEAGADDFLTKPVDDISLMARVRSLVRVKMMIDEIRLRQNTGKELGMMPQFSLDDNNISGRVLIVEDSPMAAEKMFNVLNGKCECIVESDPQPETILKHLQSQEFSLVIVSLDLQKMDGLRLCAMIRSIEILRRLCLLVVIEDGDRRKLVQALDLGVNDYVKRPIDFNEFMARVVTQLKRHHYAEQLRHNMEASMEYAVTDPLTGLFNRRYLNMHLNGLIEKTSHSSKTLALCILDIDFFKSVNDTYGHDVGDEVLQEFARHLVDNVRNVDLVVRLGGEEFVIVMPETELRQASIGADRIRAKISDTPFIVNTPEGKLSVTASIGIACLNSSSETAESLIKRADAALYRAKKTGRNRVVLHKGKQADAA